MKDIMPAEAEDLDIFEPGRSISGSSEPTAAPHITKMVPWFGRVIDKDRPIPTIPPPIKCVAYVIPITS